MWRCRWAELQIRRLLYQASKYDLQAEAISRRKKLTSEDLTIDDTGAKSPSISGGIRREKFMERRKRKRLEDSTDKAAYMAQHNLFAYIGRAFYVIGVSIFHPPTHIEKGRLRNMLILICSYSLLMSKSDQSYIAGSKRTSTAIASTNNWATLGEQAKLLCDCFCCFCSFTFKNKHQLEKKTCNH